MFSGDVSGGNAAVCVCPHWWLVAFAKEGMQHVEHKQVEPHASSGLGEVNRSVFPEDQPAVCWSSSPLIAWLHNEEHI